MTQPQFRSKDPLRQAIRRLVLGLEKQEKVRHERRRYTRHPFQVKVQLCIEVDTHHFQPLCEAWAVDLSMGGISFLAEQAISSDGNNTVYVGFEEILGQPCHIPIIVRNCRTLFGTIHQVNGQFLYRDVSGPGGSSQAA